MTYWDGNRTLQKKNAEQLKNYLLLKNQIKQLHCDGWIYLDDFQSAFNDKQ